MHAPWQNPWRAAGQIVLKKRVRALCQNAVIDYIRPCAQSACVRFLLFCFVLFFLEAERADQPFEKTLEI